jgi:hypothetical protein
MATTPGTRGLLETIRLSTWSAARCNTPVIVSSRLLAPHQRNATPEGSSEPTSYHGSFILLPPYG